MGFHVDMAELLSHLETLSSDIKSTQADLWDAKTATNRIISTQALYGHAGQAVYHQLNNYDAALHVSLSDNLMLLSGEFSRTLSAFQSQVKETSATAILDEAYLHQLSQTLVQHQEKHASIERSIASIYGDIADLVSLSSPKSSYDECTDKANRVLTHTIEWVSAFDGASTSSQTQALLERDEAILSSLQGLGSLSYTDSRYSQFVSDAHFAKYVKQVDKQIQAKIKAAKQAQEKAAKVKEIAWKKHHPIQSFIHDLEAGAIGWLDKDIKAHPNPLNRASAGFLKGAVELVSGLAEGGVNLTQVGLEELEVFGDMLQGNKPSQWKMADISGMLETEKQLARLALGTVTSNVFFDASIVLDGLPQRGNVGSIQKELRLDRQMSENFWQETSKSIAEAFKEDPAQATGCAVFEVGLLLFPWAKSGKLGETTKGAEMLNDVDKLSDGANLLQRLSKSTGFGDDLTAANQLKTFNQGLKEFSQAAKASLSKEALEDLGENLRNLTFQVPGQELALESAGTTGKIKSVGEFLDNAKVNVQRFSTSTSDDVAKVSGKLDEVGELESKVVEAAEVKGQSVDVNKTDVFSMKPYEIEIKNRAKRYNSKYNDLYDYEFNGTTNAGPLSELPSMPNRNFYGGRYNVRILEEDTILYRAGSSNNPMGQWFTTEPPISKGQVRIDTAVKDIWINPDGSYSGQSPIDKVYKIKFPKGVTTYAGPVGSQGGIYQGGLSKQQVFIETPWNIEGVEVMDSWSIIQ